MALKEVMSDQMPVEDGKALLLPGLISRAIADSFLRLLWRDMTKQPALTQTHQQQLLRKNALEIHGRNYAPLLAMHWGLTSIIAERTGADLLPSFSFFRLYFGGDICRVHSDRPACEISASLTLAYSDGLPWELSISSVPAVEPLPPRDDFGDEPHLSFIMQPGDAVLYYGNSYRHGRPTPNPNRWSAHLFLQWVERGGSHEAEAFERLDLGEGPKIGG
jgi:hypothetical protein